MDIHAVSPARRIDTVVLALALYALGLPVPLIPLADWPTGRLADWPTGRLADWPTGRLADWLMPPERTTFK